MWISFWPIEKVQCIHTDLIFNIFNCYSFSAGTTTCIVVSANFYDDWTYTETDAGFTTYFVKETGKGIKASVFWLERVPDLNLTRGF